MISLWCVYLCDALNDDHFDYYNMVVHNKSSTYFHIHSLQYLLIKVQLKRYGWFAEVALWMPICVCSLYWAFLSISQLTAVVLTSFSFFVVCVFLCISGFLLLIYFSLVCFFSASYLFVFNNTFYYNIVAFLKNKFYWVCPFFL